MHWLIISHAVAFVAGGVIYGLYARKFKQWSGAEIEGFKARLKSKL